MAAVNIASGLLLAALIAVRYVAARETRIRQPYFGSLILGAAALYDVLTPLIGH